MTRAVSAVAMVLLAAGATLAQPRPAYEAAEITVNTSGSGDADSEGSAGQVAMRNLPLKRLIANAYGVKPDQVKGPDWLDSVRFDIVAKYPANTRQEDHPLMLKTLLEDRLKVAAHRETQELPGFGLSVAKGGIKLKPAAPGDSSRNGTHGPIGALVAKNTSLPRLAVFLTQTVGQTVVDETGISGGFDFELKWTSDDLAADSGVPSLFTALQEQLGLRLQAKKVPVELIMVDHAERVPAER